MNQNGGVVSEFYHGTNIRVAEGDQVRVDGETGKIEKVLIAQTTEAEHFSCSSTGGVLVDLKKLGLVLFPFGTGHVLIKVNDKLEDK